MDLSYLPNCQIIPFAYIIYTFLTFNMSDKNLWILFLSNLILSLKEQLESLSKGELNHFWLCLVVWSHSVNFVLMPLAS